MEIKQLTEHNIFVYLNAIVVYLRKAPIGGLFCTIVEEICHMVCYRYDFLAIVCVDFGRVCG